ncbi:protein eyes shut isoform X2 [Eurytemora carolleeae]|uniref:protein eyes shut isoform X2 n=1 Tax=Eurytemora carolleeae TaxID=1294199 RepID=UPI000C794DC0|nr:protein eyes shut isoform X2 [Eurytemora carolleeae]|eukprot:XP_023335490.1 protein eyes shut-like isoform X2 [Eurytemora affinis]
MKSLGFLLLLLSLLQYAGSVPHESLEEGENPCVHAPCAHGVCVQNTDVQSGYRCYCEDGYTGYNCETDWDECWNQPCLNGGVCADGIAFFNCACPEGFNGTRCEINIDDCLSDPCFNNGTCIDQIDGYRCECEAGFRGVDCEVDIQVCNITSETGENRCSNGGECIDGLGEQFTCNCTHGWTGDTCQDNVDECQDNPCLNGGHCIDKIGDFQCSCPLFYAGRVCEEKLEQCEDSPCLNGALCLIEDDSFRCYCVPDYHGKRCQHKYNECQLPPGPKCVHGGECEDDVNGFSCSCLDGYSGQYCQCIQEEERCIDPNITLSWTIPSDFTMETEDVYWTSKSGLRDEADSTTESSTSDDTEDFINKTIVDYWEEELGIEEPGDMTTLYPGEPGEPGDMTTLYPGEGSDDLEKMYSTPELELDRTGSEGVQTSSDNFTDSMYGGTSTKGSTDSTFSTDPTDPIDLTVSTDPTGSASTTTPTDPSAFSDPTASTHSTGLTDYTSTHLMKSTDPAWSSDPTNSTYDALATDDPTASTDPTGTTGHTAVTDPRAITDPTTSTDNMASTNPTTSTDPTTETDSTASSDPTATTDPTSPTNPTASTDLTAATDATAYTDPTPSTGSTTLGDMNRTIDPSESIDTTDVTQDVTELMDSTTDITKNVTELLNLPEDNLETATRESIHHEPGDQHETVPATEHRAEHEDDLAPKMHLTTLAPKEPGATAIYPSQHTSCTQNICRNGGTCLWSIDGFQCHCKLQFSGRYCQSRIQVSTPGFLGHSYLVHETGLEDNSTLELGFRTQIGFRTTYSTGVLFYTGEQGGLLITSFLEDGILNFQVSCGHQLITFSDPKHRVNTGYEQTLEVVVTFQGEKGLDRTCITEIHLNGTHAMKGEQEVLHPPHLPQYIYIGGAPADILQDPGADILIPKVGLQGCVKHFLLQEREVELFSGAVSGQDIVECESAACSSKPCQNNGICNQHPSGASWFCECTAGFTGQLCERTICNANPCLHGGTCLGKPKGEGFVCLCPFGRRGGICEEEVEVNQPSFTSWVLGHSSFLTYQAPTGVEPGVEFKFHFTSGLVNQVALLLFMGQLGTRRQGSDYLAVSFIKGHVLLTWDLGAGPRRIFTKEPVDPRIHVHTVHAGRWGRLGWLKVDHYRNLTGLAPGKLSTLNVNGEFYIGGHESFNFTGLPHDFPVHTGFTGCIFDLVVRNDEDDLIVPVPVRGRNVQQCQERICDRRPCSNGFCLDYGASYSCQCPDGTTGPSCDHNHNICSGQRHQCQEGSTCTPVHSGAGYQCVCPLGRTGEHCEENIEISDAKFTGSSSYMALNLLTSVRFRTELRFELKVDRADGLLVYLGQSSNQFGDFLSVLLINQTLVFSFSLGAEDKVVTLKSKERLNLGDWTNIRVGRRGEEGYLQIQNQDEVRGVNGAGLHTLDVDNIIYIGGLPDMSTVSESNGALVRFAGCIRNLNVNERLYELKAGLGRVGANIQDCDGTVCGGEVCGEKGLCFLEKSGVGYSCNCTEPYTGRHCEVHSMCSTSRCKQGHCRVSEELVMCDCPLGHTGDNCEKTADISTPQFGGDPFNSYIQFQLPDHNSVSLNTELELEIRTDSDNALLVWFGAETGDLNLVGGRRKEGKEKRMKEEHGKVQEQGNQDYLGLGIEDGLLKVVWNLGWFSRSELLVPEFNISDGNWHHLHLIREEQSLKLMIEKEEEYESTVPGTYYQLNTGSSVLFGSSVEVKGVEDLTRGHFRASYKGCMRNIKIQGLKVDTSDQDRLTGNNIAQCT